MKLSPCKDCPDRYLGCHSECEKYIEFQKSRAEEKARMYEQRLADHEFYQSRRYSMMRAVQAKGQKVNRLDRFRKTK